MKWNFSVYLPIARDSDFEKSSSLSYSNFAVQLDILDQMAAVFGLTVKSLVSKWRQRLAVWIYAYSYFFPWKIGKTCFESVKLV